MVAQSVRPHADLFAVQPKTSKTGKLRMTLHPGQTRAWDSEKRFVLILAGLQSGKTSMAPPWLWREMKRKGPGDYLVGSPTFSLMELKALPEFKRFFVSQLRAGEYKGSPIRELTLNENGERKLWGMPQAQPTRILFGHAQDPDSLESGTYKAAVLDEAGQKKFRRDSWVSIQGRLSIHQGRVLFPTTPYTLGWLKAELFDPWQRSGGTHPEIDVINFASIENPVFPLVEFERMRATLPPWQFAMRYLGQFQRPAGLIYDCFHDYMGDGGHVIPRKPLPDHWPRFQGADFGGVHTAGIWIAQQLTDDGVATGKYIAYREYLAGSRTAAEHAEQWRAGEPGLPTAVGGSHSEDQYRREYRAADYPINAPDIREVEVGIERCYGMIARDELLVFEDLRGFRDELVTYSRVLDENGEPTEIIEDKSTFHRLDAFRYIGGWLNRTSNGPASVPLAIPQAPRFDRPSVVAARGFSRG